MYPALRYKHETKSYIGTHTQKPNRVKPNLIHIVPSVNFKFVCTPNQVSRGKLFKRGKIYCLDLSRTF